MEFGSGSQINIPIAVLIWLMIIPMMMKVDFASIRNVGKRPRGLLVTLFVNWLVKPFSMALIAWVFFRLVFSLWISPAEADQYIAGCIILAAAPCTAMVFVWSYLTDGDPAYTLVQVSVNDLIMLVLFAPIVRFLVSGASSLEVPFRVLLYAVAIFIVIPLAVGVILRGWFIHRKGVEWFEQTAPAALCAGQHDGAAGDAGIDLRVPGRQHHAEIPARPAHRGADSHPGVLQFVADLRADEAAQGSLFGGSPRGAHRREQLFRAGGCNGHSPFRPRLGSGPGHGCRRPHRSAGDAVGLLGLQPDPPLVQSSAAGELGGDRFANLMLEPDSLFGAVLGLFMPDARSGFKRLLGRAWQCFAHEEISGQRDGAEEDRPAIRREARSLLADAGPCR